MNHQDYLVANQTTNGHKADEIESIEKEIIAPTEMEEISKTESMVPLREKGSGISSRNILLREAVYDTVRTHTILPIQ